MKKRFSSVLLSVSILVLDVSCTTGINRARGISAPIEEAKSVRLEASFVARDIDLSFGIDTSFWETRASQRLDLYYQSMVLPWPKGVIPSVVIKAFHNGVDIFFFLEWEDETKDDTIGINRFPDACAVMFTLEENRQNISVTMGFQGKSNVWQWKASQDRDFWLGERAKNTPYVDFHYPFEEEELFVVSKQEIQSGANDLVTIGVGTISLKSTQNVEGRGLYDNGVWRVVFKRALQSLDPLVDAKFEKANSHLCAFAVWDGSKGDRGGRKSFSYWIELSLN